MASMEQWDINGHWMTKYILHTSKETATTALASAFCTPALAFTGLANGSWPLAFTDLVTGLHPFTALSS